MSEALNIKTLIVILIAGILLTSSNSMPFVKSQPTHTSLTIAAPSEPQLKECTIEATLKDENGNPLQNMDVDFYICGSNKIGTAKTDSNGLASLKFTPSEPEIYTNSTIPIKAKFSGTTNYTQSSSEYGYITVIIDYTSYIVSGGLGAVAIIGVVGYIIFRRRKEAITMPVTTEEMEPSKLAETLFTNIMEE